MKRLLIVIFLIIIAVSLIVPFAFATEGSVSASDAKLSYLSFATLGCTIGMGLAVIGTGIGMGFGLKGATEGTARNPEASGKIMTTLIIGLAMIESLAIYALVVVLITFYANPFVK